MLPRPARVAIAVSAAALAFGLSACAPSSPEPSPTPPSTTDAAAPIFESDEEALQAAVEAYEAFTAKSAEISARGGEGAEEIAEFVSAEELDGVLSDFADMRESGMRLQGASRLEQPRLADWEATPQQTLITFYGCRNITDLRIIGADGQDVTPADRDEVIPTQVVVVSDPSKGDALVVESVETWQGDDFC